MRSYRVNGEVHADGELVLDSLVNDVSHFSADVLVFVDRPQHLVDLAIFTV